MCHPLSYSDECSFGSCQIVFAIGFVSVDEKSVARNSELVILALVTNWNSSFLNFAKLKGNWLFKTHSLKLLSNQNLWVFIPTVFLFLISNDSSQMWHSNVDIVSQDVKCWTCDQVVEEVIWGLKYVLCDFVSEESTKITDNYILPLSKQLLMDLQTYGIKVSPSEVLCSPCYCNAILYSIIPILLVYHNNSYLE